MGACFGRGSRVGSKCSKLLFRLLSFLAAEDGQDLVEYALLLALISIGAVAAIHGIGTRISTLFTNISTTIA